MVSRPTVPPRILPPVLAVTASGDDARGNVAAGEESGGDGTSALSAVLR